MEIACKNCGESLKSHAVTLINDCDFTYNRENEIFAFERKNSNRVAEIETRNRQASNYLLHKKVISQTKFFRNFLKINNLNSADQIVLDIGCGPGPSVQQCNNYGFKNITAVDFSHDSLVINKEQNLNLKQIYWLRADLKDVTFKENSVDLLIMADFIQHVGNYDDKKVLLQNAMAALRPGGCFYFSFFNFNIINYLKGDLHGYFSEKTIPYERLLPTEMIKLLEKTSTIKKAYPMNFTHNYKIDYVLGKLPLSKYFARMYAIEGVKNH